MSNEWVAAVVVIIGLVAIVLALGPRWRKARRRRDEETVISRESFRPADRPDVETRFNWSLNMGAMWTEEVQPLLKVVVGLIDHSQHIYLAAPRLSDFLSVHKRYRGDQAGVAMETRLRQNRIALAFLEPKTGRPQAAVMFSWHDNRVAKGACEAVELPFVIVSDTKLPTIKNAMDQLEIVAIAGSRPTRRPAAAPMAMAAQGEKKPMKQANPSQPSRPIKPVPQQPASATSDPDLPAGLQTLAGLGGSFTDLS